MTFPTGKIKIPLFKCVLHPRCIFQKNIELFYTAYINMTTGIGIWGSVNGSNICCFGQ